MWLVNSMEARKGSRLLSLLVFILLSSVLNTYAAKKAKKLKITTEVLMAFRSMFCSPAYVLEFLST